MADKALSFIKENVDKISKEELKKHKLYHFIILSTPDPNKSKHTFLDFSQEEIDKDPETKRFFEIDLLIKKFISDEYEKIGLEKNEEEIINF